MELSLNVDTYLHSILSLRDELDSVCERVTEKYDTIDTPAVIGIALRCLPEDIERKTFKRYDKKDRYLTIDISLSYKKYKSLLKVEQRHELGHALYHNIVDAISKYNFTELMGAGFIKDFEI
ncbi:hypothetical protein AB6805_13935 [Chitinophaga sp. RCC_12]|uniref:hypothetical protein n=1 Tax=Chitinophaga sp. RCC_12 TaxID=3239226 RepID=UPI003523B24A